MIEGDHVRLRRLERGDLPLMHRWFNDQDVVSWARFSPDLMTSLTAIEKEYEKELAGEEKDRTTYIVEEKDTAKPLGWCVLRMHDRKHVNANVGIGLGEKGYWGKGYGTEAVRLLLTIAFDHQGWHRVEMGTLAENRRAIRSAEKLGFRKEGHQKEAAYFSGSHRDVVLMAVLKSEWDAQRKAPEPPVGSLSDATGSRILRTGRRRRAT